jgi:membrane fusion protein, multidrug efflux system
VARGRGIRTGLARLIAAVVIGAAAAGLLSYLRELRLNPYTDDASIDADVVHLAPTVAGRIVRLPITENQLVRAGDVLFEIDPEPFRLRVALAEADLKAAEALLDTRRRNVSGETSNAASANEQVSQARTSLQLASNTLSRLQPLLPKGYVSVQQVDDAQTAKRKAEVAYTQATLQAAAAKSTINTTDEAEAAVQARRATLALAERDLREATVRAPHDGRVTGLSVRSGETISPAQSLFTLVVTEEWFASANFRETDLSAIAVGSCAVAYSLIDRRTAIHGRVDGIGFGVKDGDRTDLPRGVPYVAKSVNWVRVDQRFPVRVRLVDPPEQLMRLGASALVQIRPGDRC